MSEREQIEGQATDETDELTAADLDEVTGGAVDMFHSYRKAGDELSFSWGATQIVMP